MGGTLLDRVLAGRSGAFALLQRQRPDDPGTLEVLTGAVVTVPALAAIPLPPPGVDGAGGPRYDILAVIPYRQVAERGFACVDDGTPLVAMTVTEHAELPTAQALDRLPDVAARVVDGHFDIPDDAYADIVRRVLRDEIGTGQGANFVVKRTFVADLDGYTLDTALGFFRRLLQRESGAYWTFLVHTGGRTLVGATPERHVSLHGGTVMLNPISGTYRYPPTGPTLPGVLRFLADRKETDELHMVVDEELKMMSRVSDAGGRVLGPYLKEMAHLAHTEYLIEGRTTCDPREILQETMFAPTVTGSPLESACRVIGRYEPAGRGYYSGVVALIGRDAAGRRTLDSAICIRTADIDARGRMRIGVGATLVRHSDPDAEVSETRAKARGLLTSLAADPPAAAPAARGRGGGAFGGHPDVRDVLRRRNERLAAFWFANEYSHRRVEPELAGRRILVVDAEDTFTSMIACQLRALGATATVCRYDEPFDRDAHDLVVMGPGPGDPASDELRIAHLRSTLRTLLDERRPFLAVCLSHQVLSTQLGLPLRRRAKPNQGIQREIHLFGQPEVVGFYNTFVAFSAVDATYVDGVGPLEVSRDPGSGEVHALRGDRFASIQFHAESVLTLDGIRILGRLIRGVMGGAGPDRPADGALFAGHAAASVSPGPARGDRTAHADRSRPLVRRRPVNATSMNFGGPVDQRAPVCSVIIPTYNRQDLIRHTLNSLLRQSLPPDRYEVFVIDDGSSDDTRQVVTSFQDKLNLHYHFQTDRGWRVPEARNVGVRNASSDICVFTDAGVQLRSNCLAAHVNRHEASPEALAIVGYVWGYANPNDPPSLTEADVDVEDPDGTIERLAKAGRAPDAREAFYRKYTDEIGDLPAPWVVHWTCNTSARTSRIREVGGFDEVLHNWGGEDLDLGYRLHRSGVRFVLDRNAAAIHLPHEKDIHGNRRSAADNYRYLAGKYKTPIMQLLPLFPYLDPYTMNDYIRQLELPGCEEFVAQRAALGQKI